MYLDKNYDRSQADGMTGGEFDYKKKYEPYPSVFEGNCFDVEVLLAQMSIREGENKKGGTYRQEQLSLVLKIQDKYWCRVNIKGAYLKDDGSDGRNPVKLHDFLCLAERQAEDCLGGASSYTFDDGRTVTTFPKLYGMKFKMVIATVGNYQGYDVNEVGFFALDGHSAVELELNQTEVLEIKNFAREVKGKREQYLDELKAEAGLRSDGTPYGQQSTVTNPDNSFPEDDVPF